MGWPRGAAVAARAAVGVRVDGTAEPAAAHGGGRGQRVVTRQFPATGGHRPPVRVRMIASPLPGARDAGHLRLPARRCVTASLDGDAEAVLMWG